MQAINLICTYITSEFIDTRALYFLCRYQTLHVRIIFMSCTMLYFSIKRIKSEFSAVQCIPLGHENVRDPSRNNLNSVCAMFFKIQRIYYRIKMI